MKKLSIGLTIAALIYLVAIMTSPSRRQRPNPYEYRVDAAASSDSSLARYAQVNEFMVPGRQLSALAIDPRDRLYVAADSALFIYSLAGHLKARVHLGHAAHCLAAADGKRLYIGFRDHISLHDHTGRVKATWPLISDQSFLTSLAVSEKYVYAADAGQRLICCYDPQGRLLRSFGHKDSLNLAPELEVPSPFFDVVVDRDQQLWAVNPGQHTIGQYAENGRLISFWGKAGNDLAGFCGCCNPTHIALLSDGSFVTSEKGLCRVKVYSPAGRLYAQVADEAQFEDGVTGLDLAVDKQDNIYLLDPARKSIRIFSRQ